jgi:putative spermidine/putrescine transport system permease protein
MNGMHSRDQRTRNKPAGPILPLLLCPAMVTVIVFFGGGLIMGLIQGLGYLPAAGMKALTLKHFSRVLYDPGFGHSLILTFYVAATSTVIAAVLGIVTALIVHQISGRSRLVNLLLQVPLTVPHLVIAVAVMFMLSPTGLLSRIFQALGVIPQSSDFPLLVNDSWCIGILITYVWKEIPFIAIVLLSVLHNTGRDLLDVGRTLKAGRWQRFRYITLPVIFPSLSAASLIVFAYTFGAFEVPFLLGQSYPLLLPVWAYKNYSDVDLLARPEGIATGIIIALVVILCIILAQLATKAARRKGVIL